MMRGTDGANDDELERRGVRRLILLGPEERELEKSLFAAFAPDPATGSGATAGAAGPAAGTACR